MPVGLRRRLALIGVSLARQSALSLVVAERLLWQHAARRARKGKASLPLLPAPIRRHSSAVVILPPGCSLFIGQQQGPVQGIGATLFSVPAIADGHPVEVEDCVRESLWWS